MGQENTISAIPPVLSAAIGIDPIVISKSALA